MPIDMPYSVVHDLPPQVQNVLPLRGQEIYKQAFNSAYKQYKLPRQRRDPMQDAETVAHKVAWSAVKQVYHKVSGKWELKNPDRPN